MSAASPPAASASTTSSTTTLPMKGAPRPWTGKYLILCFDGTGDSFDDANTNVVKLYSLLDKNRTDKQMIYYQPGLGTYISTGFYTKFAENIASKMDKGFASYLDSHIIGGYRFLQENYQPGDKICLFGFSRGAYTARGLAGMLHMVGLLPKDNIEQIHFAYELFRKFDPKTSGQCRKFKHDFGRKVDIHFLGCWDTVSSVGLVYGKTLPNTRSNSSVLYFRHALALDEHRAKFRPNFAKDPDDKNPVTSDDYTYLGLFASAWKWAVDFVRPPPPKPQKVEQPKYQRILDTDEDIKRFKEVWFAGVHADVGGGSTSDNAINGLGNASLRWMVGEFLQACPGIMLNLDLVNLITLGMQPREADESKYFGELPHPLVEEATLQDHIGKIGAPKPTLLAKLAAEAMQKEDARRNSLAPKTLEFHTQSVEIAQKRQLALDLNSGIHDQLKKNRKWWILEFIPLERYVPNKDNILRRVWRFNLGRGREFPKKEVYLFHHTVKKLQDIKSYKFRARFPKGWTNYRIQYEEDYYQGRDPKPKQS